MNIIRKLFPALLLLALALPLALFAGDKKGKVIATSGALYQEIQHMDSVMFNAFNSRDIRTLMRCFDSSLELYQDNVGVRNYAETADAFAGLFKKDYVLTRRLVKGSMEVYPIKGYGAIQTGLHTFSHTENGKSESATFKFMHVWQNKGGVWRITRLITYDH